jgi:hypothetical protein
MNISCCHIEWNFIAQRTFLPRPVDSILTSFGIIVFMISRASDGSIFLHQSFSHQWYKLGLTLNTIGPEALKNT